MWEKTCRSRTKLRRDHSEWLKRSKTIDLEDQNLKVNSPTELEEHLEPKKVGRKRKAFDECGPRTKKYEIAELRELYPASLLEVAAASASKAAKDDITCSFDEALADLLDIGL